MKAFTKDFWFMFCLLGAQFVFAELPTEIEVSAEFTAPSFDNAGDNSYTPVWSFNGSTYFVWIDSDWRPWVAKITNGTQEVVPLDPNPDYQACGSDGHHKFSMGIDKDGYIHITGDMHGYPGASTHMPERYQDNIIMYWVSNSPENISDGFTYVGDDADRAMEGHSFTYGAFYADKFGELYYRTRVRAVLTDPPSHFPGEMGVGIYKYNTQTKSWTARGAKAPISKSGAEFYNVVTWGSTGEHDGWYQGYRGTMRFDDNNRLHYAEPITGVVNKEPTHILYAYSDDGGITFKRADGSAVALPMTSAAGDNQPSVADSYQNSSGVLGGHDLHAGVFVDANNTPAVTFKRNEGDKNAGFRYWNSESSSWSDIVTPSAGASIREMHFVHPAGFLIYIKNSSGRITLAQNFEDKGNYFDTGFDTFRSVDEYGLRRTGVLRASGEKDGKLHVIQITFKGVDMPVDTGTSNPPAETEITSLSLVDGSTELVLPDYGDLAEVDTVKIHSLDAETQNIFANVSGNVDSVVFNYNLNGTEGTQKEAVVPYGLRGDGSGYDDWSIVPGHYSISATAYYQGRAQSTQSVSFVAIEDITALQQPQLPESSFGVWYNPSTNNLSLHNLNSGKTDTGYLEIYNVQGTQVHKDRVLPGSKSLDISTNQMNSGAYYVKLGREVRQFVK